MIKSKPIIIIIDTLAYIYRAYYAYPKLLSTKKYKPVGAIFGFLNMITQLLNIYSSNYIIFIFDSRKGINYRNLLYKKYKLNRKPMPLDLYLQINPIKKILYNLGFKSISIYSLEADDIIGSIINKYIYNEKFNILISTIDKDLFQLINNKNIYLHNILDKKIYGYNNIDNKFGLKSYKLIVEYLSLLGDTSDNIKGVPGIGKISATKICNYFGTISNLIQKIKLVKQISNLKNRFYLYESIKKNIKLIKLNYQLIKIKNNNKLIDKKIKDIKINNPNKKKLLYLLKYYELNYWIKKIENLLSINKLYKKYN